MENLFTFNKSSIFTKEKIIALVLIKIIFNFTSGKLGLSINQKFFFPLSIIFLLWNYYNNALFLYCYYAIYT